MADLREILHIYKGQRIAIYGLSRATEEVIEVLKNNLYIVGLLDSFQESGSLYGYPIYSLQNIIQKNVKCIVVAARPGSCKAIARKIGDICKQEDIALIDIRGNNLLLEPAVKFYFATKMGKKKEDLIQYAHNFAVISFDLFDTLITRQTLYFSDFLELVYKKLNTCGMYVEDFVNKRLACEKELSQHSVPTLEEIYQAMIKKYHLTGWNHVVAAQQEWKTDLSILIPRKDMCALLRLFLEQGKTIYIISDSYYNKFQIQTILDCCEIKGYTDILISCEYETGKTENLFSIWNMQIHNLPALHIGDDLLADIECAQKHGVASYYIHSTLELFEMTGYLGLKKYMSTWEERLHIGLFVNRLMNSPFQFEHEGNGISIKYEQDIGYLFFAPLLSDFVIWLNEQLQSNQIHQILFAARDGYLVQKMYTSLYSHIKAYYFLTSRIAMIRACVETEEDIDFVEQMKFSGTIQQEILDRFGLLWTKKEKDRCKTCLSDYKEEIFRNAVQKKKNYKCYIKNLGLEEESVAFFDFISKGTCQYFLKKMIPNHVKGFYFSRMEENDISTKNLEINTFYTPIEWHNSKLFEDYYIMEVILTSPFPSVVEFDSTGNPIFASETRSNQDIRCIEQIQNGILEYWELVCEIMEDKNWWKCKDLDEILLSLIHRFNLEQSHFIGLKVEDPFFHRQTNIADLI